mmetsp:Transcript_7339/g.30392  ORF Transcript_7339/g.30392 Transcript_7339/m.30392 type:complete len:278 (+) Transcript_7339:835-1668(+)
MIYGRPARRHRPKQRSTARREKEDGVASRSPEAGTNDGTRSASATPARRPSTAPPARERAVLNNDVEEFGASRRQRVEHGPCCCAVLRGATTTKGEPARAAVDGRWNRDALPRGTPPAYRLEPPPAVVAGLLPPPAASPLDEGRPPDDDEAAPPDAAPPELLVLFEALATSFALTACTAAWKVGWSLNFSSAAWKTSALRPCFLRTTPTFSWILAWRASCRSVVVTLAPRALMAWRCSVKACCAATTAAMYSSKTAHILSTVRSAGRSRSIEPPTLM